MPLAELLGGRDGETVELYRSVAQASPAAMADQADALREARLPADPGQGGPRSTRGRRAHGGGAWTCCRPARSCTPTPTRRGRRRRPPRSCARPATSTTCSSSRARDHDANVTVRAVCDRPFVLDESIDSLASLLRAHRAGLIDGVTLKIARLGGVSRTRLVRDVAVELGLAGDGRGHRRGAGRHGGDRPPVAQHAGDAHARTRSTSTTGSPSPTAPVIWNATTAP